MAGRDYISCKYCECRIIYDGNDEIRSSMEERWGNPNTVVWTVQMICPKCLKKLERELKECRG